MPQNEITLADARSYINDGVEGRMVKFRSLVLDHETLVGCYLIAQSIVRAAEIVADAIDRLDR